MWLLCCLFVCLLFFYVYRRHTRFYGYFESHGIFEPPKCFPFGTLHNWKVFTGRLAFFRSLDDVYAEYGRTRPYLGTFMNSTPVLVVTDLELCRRILIRDHDHFASRRSLGIDSTREVNRVTANMLTMLQSERWKLVRSSVAPITAAARLRELMPALHRVGHNLGKVLKTRACAVTEFDVKPLIDLFMLDCVASSAYGIHSDALMGRENELKRRVTEASKNPFVMVNAIIAMCWPDAAKLLKTNFVDKSLQKYLIDLVRDRFEECAAQRGADSQDMLSTFLKAFKKIDSWENEKNGDLTKDEAKELLFSNAVALFMAAYDTTSTAITMALGFLAKHQDVQDKVHREVEEVMTGFDSDELTYEKVASLKYTEKVVHETLRLYFSGIVERVCTKDWQLPDSDFVLPKGMVVQFPGSAIHQDSRYFPDPDGFNPEDNFSDASKDARSHLAFMAFGHGPRHCQGMRFAMLVTKFCLARTISQYRFLPGKNMPDQFFMDPLSLSFMNKGSIWCNVQKR